MKRHLKYRTPVPKNISSAVQVKPLPWTAKNFGWDPTRPTVLSSLLDKFADYFTLR